MNVLAFDTSTEALSICLMIDKEITIFDSLRGLRHGETLLPNISRMMKDFDIQPEDLDLLVCSRGPGSFTGLRIGMTTAKGLSEGSGVPLVSIDTLDAFAWGFSFFNGSVVPVIDARKSRYYGAVYEKGERKTKQLDCTSSDLLQWVKDCPRILVTGPGAPSLIDDWGDKKGGLCMTPIPTCSTGYSLAVLGIEQFQSEGPDDPGQGPVYIRESDAELSRK